MPPAPPILTTNTLFYGDNLDILREYLASNSIDLVYLDPPFNSNRNYNVLFKDEGGIDSEAQITAFEDTWHWNHAAAQTYHELVTQTGGEVGTMIGALHTFIGENQMMAYLVMMAARLVELHRVLKPTGSLYLHCDPTASHYLKIILDTIFGPINFRNELVWKRSDAHSDAKQGAKHYGRLHDVLLFYSKTDKPIFNTLYRPLPQSTVDNWYSNIEAETGRKYNKADVTGPGGAAKGNPLYEWKGVTRYWRYKRETMEKLDAEGRLVYSKSGMPYQKRYLDESKGVSIQDWWDDIEMLRGIREDGERLGYPTQKPLSLLERIVSASSNPNDIVLDPFCGCGTAIAAAQKLGRRWIGIDVTALSVALQKSRLKAMFNLTPGVEYKVVGEPEDLASAKQLAADDKYQFQWWALSLLPARPLGGETGSKIGKKGSDRGIDGDMTFIDDKTGKPKRVLVQVKGGHVKSGDVRDLRGTIEREGAAIGVFVTLEPSTSEMNKEAVAAGFYHSPGLGKDYPKLQIFTIADLLKGAEVKMPQQAMTTFKQARRVQEEGEQHTLDL